MKKILFLMAMLFTIIFTGCEKEESQQQQLSEFIVGVWRSDDQTIDDGQSGEILIYYTNSFYPDGTYTTEMSHSLVDGGGRIDTATFTPYVLNNGTNVISVNDPDWALDNEAPTDEIINFDIEWIEGTHTMTWTPSAGQSSDIPTIIWTFWHDIEGIEGTHTMP
jgi:hypothetical protein